MPAVDHELVGDADVAALKQQLLDSGLTRRAAGRRPRGRRPRASAAPTSGAAPTAPGSGWSRSAAGRSTSPSALATVLATLEQVQQRLQRRPPGGKAVSLADLIVLGGCAAVEKAARNAGVRRHGAVPARTHRRHARSRPTSSRSRCSSRRPTASATTSATARSCRRRRCCSTGRTCSTLTAPEMTVLVGGMRALGANAGGSDARRADRPAGDADERLLREPARAGRGVAARRSRRRTSTRSGTRRPVT